MNKSQELPYFIALSLIPGVGDVMAKKLIAYCGSAEAVFIEKKAKLEKIPGVGPVLAKSVISHREVDRALEEIKFIEKYKIKALTFLDPEYPVRFKQCHDSPIVLYYKGTSDLNQQKVIGVVGTRNMTEYGKSACSKLIQDLAPHQPLIVSGLAYGVDILAHKVALDNDLDTIGVVGHGLDRIYPSIHKPVAERMVKQGGLLTEFLSETTAERENFPKRNRIVAGICDAVIIVEASIKGGALITAEIANSYNRDVFAFPGRVGDTYSEGCNKLIKSHKAALIESAKDIEYILGWEKNEKKKKVEPQLFPDLTADEQLLVDFLRQHGPSGIDNISLLSNLTMGKVASLLLNLEFAGMVKALPGKVYKLN